MHEMSLIESVLRIIEEQAATENFSHVKTVRLEVGELSHAEPEALRFCFEAAAGNTLVAGAELEIIRAPGRAFCAACDKQVTLMRLIDGCPHCGGHGLQVAAGKELRVLELEVQ